MFLINLDSRATRKTLEAWHGMDKVNSDKTKLQDEFTYRSGASAREALQRSTMGKKNW